MEKEEKDMQEKQEEDEGQRKEEREEEDLCHGTIYDEKETAFDDCKIGGCLSWEFRLMGVKRRPYTVLHM